MAVANGARQLETMGITIAQDYMGKKQRADRTSKHLGTRDPIDVLLEHARLSTANEDEAGIRAASICEPTPSRRHALIPEPCRIPGMCRSNTPSDVLSENLFGTWNCLRRGRGGDNGTAEERGRWRRLAEELGKAVDFHLWLGGTNDF